MSFDLNWPQGYTTRDGRKVTIYCTDAPGKYPIHGRIDGFGAPLEWKADGSFLPGGLESSNDLINAPEPVKRIDQIVFVNVWQVTKTYHATEELAEEAIRGIGVEPVRAAVPCRLVEIEE